MSSSVSGHLIQMVRNGNLLLPKTWKRLVSWYFQPSRPQMIMSGLKINLNLSPNYSAHKSANCNFSRKKKKKKINPISLVTNLCSKNKPYILKHQHKTFKKLVPLVLPLLKKHIRLGHVMEEVKLITLIGQDKRVCMHFQQTLSLSSKS